MRPTITTPALALALALGASRLAAQQPDPSCAPAADRRVPTETVVERTALTAELAGALADAPAPRVSQLRRLCPAVVKFVESPFDTGSVVPGLAQLDAAMGLLAALARPDSSTAGGVPSAGVDPSTAVPVSAAVPGAAGASVPAVLAEGARTFFVERAKDEAVYAFVLNLGREVEKHPFVRHGFPRSYALMREIRIGTFQTLMPAVRTAVSEDLQLLPKTLGTDSVVSLLDPALPATVTAADRERARAYLVGLGLVFRHASALRRGSEPAATLSALLSEAADLKGDATGRVALRLVGALAHEYAADGGEGVRELLTEPAGRSFFAAHLADDLLRREGWRRADPRGSALLASLAARRVELAKLERHLRTAEEVATLLHSADAGAGYRERAEQFVRASGTLLQTVGTALEIVPTTLQPGSSPLRGALADAARLNEALAGRDYSALVGWVVEQPVLRAAAGPTGMKYLGFASTLAAARSADEVATALRTVSAPVGSYRAKRNQFDPPEGWSLPQRVRSGESWGPLAVSVTGFVGGAFGKETARGLATGASGTPAGEAEESYYGLALPVGLELSAGVPFGSVSLFASLLDLGTLSSRRTGGGTQVDDGAQVGWSQVLAPGAFVTLGVRGMPIVVGYGVQRVEGLRESADGTRTLDVHRHGVFVGIDVTVFRIH